MKQLPKSSAASRCRYGSRLKLFQGEDTDHFKSDHESSARRSWQQTLNNGQKEEGMGEVLEVLSVRVGYCISLRTRVIPDNRGEKVVCLTR